MFIAVNGMALRADSHNGLFLMVKLCQRAVFSKLSHLEDINVNTEKLIYIFKILYFQQKFKNLRTKKLTCQYYEKTIKYFLTIKDGSLNGKAFFKV